jgi:hypothetical protein
MCRSIRPLHRAEVAPTELDVRDAAVQYVRKLSGIRSPSKADAPAFEAAVEEVTAATHKLLAALRPMPPVPGRIPLRHLHR